MTINELIKKYEEELKNCIEQEEVWEKEFSKTDDENYKFACRKYITEFRMQKVCCNRFLQDLDQLKEKIDECAKCICAVNSEYLDLIYLILALSVLEIIIGVIR